MLYLCRRTGWYGLVTEPEPLVRLRTVTIISHTRRFIFIKARKVASSSLLVALGRHCADPDIVTSPGDSEGYPDYAMNNGALKTHMHPAKIRRLVTPDQWRDYTKITSVRNPWDVAVSSLLWRLYRGGGRWGITYSDVFRDAVRDKNIDPSDKEYRCHFENVLKDLPRNCDFYFDDDGNPYADVHLRYESLQHDFDRLCRRLGIPPSPLPHLKAQSRSADWSYRSFYDSYLRDRVGEIAHRTIDYFGYRF
jgi:hypothetical protein